MEGERESREPMVRLVFPLAHTGDKGPLTTGSLVRQGRRPGRRIGEALPLPWLFPPRLMRGSKAGKTICSACGPVSAHVGRNPTAK